MRHIGQIPWRSPYAILVVLLGCGFCGLGLNFLIEPHSGAAGYGVTVASFDGDPFLRAKGLRDLASGIVLLCLLTFSSMRAVALALLSITIIPVGDAIIVAFTGLAPTYAVPMHGITALVMFVTAWLMNRSARLDVIRGDTTSEKMRGK